MIYLPNLPLLLFPITFGVLWLSAVLGAKSLRRWRSLDTAVRHEFDLIRAATLTLLGLVIGFTFSMAMNRYDQRKNLEQAEANAIGTLYLRADLLPAEDAAKLRELLREYLDQRIKVYVTRAERQTSDAERRAAELERALWSVAPRAASAQPTPATALAVAGINDVLNAASDAKAARLNRIPHNAWHLMFFIAVFCSVLVGFGAPDVGAGRLLLTILPLVVSTSFFLIADIDTPLGGVIRIAPENLQRLVPLMTAE